jgi:predicted RNA-binding Zn ribbon-like protein
MSTKPRRPFAFFAGHPALDLPATLTGRFKPLQRELLERPEDLGSWFVEAGLAAAAPRIGPADLALARDLRESIYATALAHIGGRALPARDIGVLNRIAAGKSAVPRLDTRGRVHTSATARALLVDLARDAIRLLGDRDTGRVRQCEGELCARLFIDTSKTGDRRWCSMSGCGNKAKVAQFRRRLRDAART